MAYGNGFGSEEENRVLGENSERSDEIVNANQEVKTLEGVDFTKFVEVQYLSKDEAKKRVASALEKERPVDYRYIELMKRDGVTEDFAIKAFVGRFGGNESQTRFFLNADFYYGSEAPTPLTRLIKAREEDAFAECIEMIEDTKISWDYGDHF